jgi:hypothetical protein
MKINSKQIKASLMSYYRFKRGYICVDEASCSGGLSDVLVDTGKYIIDVEVKISKSDLINGEAKKSKHYMYKNCDGHHYYPNKFVVCVPENLRTVAEEWVLTTNKKYGILVYTPPVKGFRHKRADFESNLLTVRNAKSFNKCYNGEYFGHIISKRLSSALINSYQVDLINKNKDMF